MTCSEMVRTVTIATPALLRARAEAMLADERTHPMMRALCGSRA
jgi:hypothetical protein